MKNESKRNLYLKVRVSQEEMNAIKRKYKNSGMDSLSGFVRAMIFEGYIVQMDENELRQIHKLASNIANNINQIAVRVNSTGNIYVDDIAEIKDGVNKLWQPLNFLKTKILQLKH
ncbi:MAG: MobC family plasmid mobilization relaxosome protein [Ruminococcus sp.]|nr:MobC family plasmid mobilization relaxosome protein [Ruminococcus sp.]